MKTAPSDTAKLTEQPSDDTADLSLIKLLQCLITSRKGILAQSKFLLLQLILEVTEHVKFKDHLGVSMDALDSSAVTGEETFCSTSVGVTSGDMDGNLCLWGRGCWAWAGRCPALCPLSSP